MCCNGVIKYEWNWKGRLISEARELFGKKDKSKVGEKIQDDLL